jgi:hypothetical protein
MFEDDTDQSDLPWPQHAERERRAFLKKHLDQWRETSAKKHPEYSLRYRLLDEITKDSISKVSEADPRRYRDIHDKLYEAEDLVSQLCQAATSCESDWDKREQLDFWNHAVHPAYEIKKKTYKLNLKNEVEGVASYYLSQPLRGQLFDRTLVDMLIALELYQFADEMIHPFRFPGLPVTSPLKQPHPLWLFIRDNAIVTAVLGGIGWAAGAAMADYRIGDWGGWVIGICFVLWIINAGWSVIALPFVWKRWAKARKKALELLEGMLSTYARMQSDSVISASHVLDGVKTSSAVGVAWPSPLYVVLEDVIVRGGRL